MAKLIFGSELGLLWQNKCIQKSIIFKFLQMFHEPENNIIHFKWSSQ